MPDRVLVAALVTAFCVRNFVGVLCGKCALGGLTLVVYVGLCPVLSLVRVLAMNAG